MSLGTGPAADDDKEAASSNIVANILETMIMVKEGLEWKSNIVNVRLDVDSDYIPRERTASVHSTEID